MKRLSKIFMAGVAFLGLAVTLFADVVVEEGSRAVASDGGILSVIPLIIIVLSFLAIIGMWKVFTKAGKPGWAILIPIYNTIVMLEIAGRPIWWIILLFIPFVNVVISIIIALDIANKFGKGPAFGLGLAFFPFIFYPVLGYGDSKYNG